MSEETNQPTANAILNECQSISPTYIQLVNESMNHAGYFEGKESHFKLTIVSDVFVDKRLIVRHQLIYRLVNHLMTAQGGSIHALALHTYTPDEWEQQQQSPDSPNCAGANR